MFGKEAALKIIENSVARKTMVEAGKKAFMKEAVKESAKVITYGAAEQVAQEAPAQYAQVVGNQMKAQDMGTLYVDAATAVETPEGFLICKDVPIARTGTHQYRGFEFGGDDPMELYDVHRPEEEVDKKRDRLRCHRKNHRRCLRELWILHLKKNIPEPVMENLQKEMLKSPQKKV